MFDVIVENGTLVDGTGNPRRAADVGILSDRIAAIGQLGNAPATRRIDATGLIVAPGFIDVHNHSDGLLLREDHLLCKTTQGFTTEILMSDGISYAPVDERTWREWFFYLRALNGLRMDEYVGWESVGQYMALLDQTNVQNSAAQVAYANVRSLACGFGRNPIDDFQRRQIDFEIRQAMEEGAVGMSTGIDYIVQCFATTDELVDACRAIQPYDGLYVTHVRYKLGLLPALEEAFQIARRAEVRLHISHLKAQTPQETEQVFALLDREGGDVDYSFDVYPYQPGSTMLNYLLPYEVWEHGPLAALSRLTQPDMLRRFRLGLDSYRLDLDQIRIAWTAGKENAAHQGVSLRTFIEQSGLAPEEALARLLVEERLATLLVFVEGEDPRVEPFLQHDRYMMGSDGIYFHDGPIHPRVYGSGPRLLGPCVRERGLFTLEQAVRKMTGWPAARFGLIDRGLLKEGALADVVVFDAEEITDLATYENPHQVSVGVREVIVNGCSIIANGEPLRLTGPLPGRFLRRGLA